jgi:hypothetical protein
LTVTTPSLGVRQWRDDASAETVCVAWASAGGRGVPRRAIFLPVINDHKTGARWLPPQGLLEELEADPRGFWSKLGGRFAPRHARCDQPVGPGQEDPATDPAAPRATSIPDTYGVRWGADHVLVLLVYDGPPAVGDQGDLQQTVAALDEDDETLHRCEIEQLKTFFFEKYDERLVSRGLARLTRPPAGDNVVLALASCHYPADMTDGAPGDHNGPEALASASLLRLSRLLTPNIEGKSPSLLVLTGDQVYIDATAGLFDARAKTDRLRLPYQNLMRSPGAQSVFGLLPVATMIDDHEIVDNWEPGVPVLGAFEDSVQAYRRFQRMAGPPLRGDNALWYEFTHAGVPFFFADTRTERHTPAGTPRDVGNWREARIMHDTQWQALKKFLVNNKENVSFVVSPSMLLPRDLGLGREPALALECDDWDGYPTSRDQLLALLCENDLQRVVFLSGDAHTSCVAKATVTRDGHRATLSSVHSSGLYCPYPFANGSREDYACDEVFEFQTAVEPGDPFRRYRCEVTSLRWEPGDGFATLALTRSVTGHSLQVCFHRAREVVPVCPITI